MYTTKIIGPDSTVYVQHTAGEGIIFDGGQDFANWQEFKQEVTITVNGMDINSQKSHDAKRRPGRRKKEREKKRLAQAS